MKSTNYCKILVTLLAGTACEVNNRVRTAPARDSAGIQIIENHEPAWTIPWTLSSQPIVTIGSIDGPPEYEFTRIISAFRLPDSRIVVANFMNPPNIRVYSATGEHIATMGRAGEGPGEFQAIAWVDHVGSDTLRAFDYWNARVTYFATNGEVIESHPVRTVAGAPTSTFILVPGLQGGDLVTRLNRLIPPNVEGRGRTLIPLIRVTPLGAAIDTIVSIQDADYYVSPSGDGILVPFGARAGILPAGDRLFVTTGEAHRIDEYGPDGILLRSIRRFAEERPVTPEHLAVALEQQLQNARTDTERARQRRIYSELPHSEFLPAYDRGMLMDRFGSLWVKQYPAPQDTIIHWDIFDSAGRYLGAVAVPRPFDLRQIGVDEVLGVWQDELDIQSVRIFELNRGS